MTRNESEIRFWLKNILTEENLDHFSVNILGNAAKDEGHVGDIVFISLTSAESPKEYHLVLKCSKQNKTLRETTPDKECFTNEIYVYDTVFPSFLLSFNTKIESRILLTVFQNITVNL
jgi:hypothetical protein